MSVLYGTPVLKQGQVKFYFREKGSQDMERKVINGNNRQPLWEGREVEVRSPHLVDSWSNPPRGADERATNSTGHSKNGECPI